MGVVELIEEAVEPFSGGQPFGDTGSYELVRGWARIELDAANPANEAITDLARAAQVRPGVVELRSDVVLLRPVAPSRGNGCLLGVVPNRGSTGGLPFTLGAQVGLGGDLSVEAGDGWPLHRGWTIAWAGWQWDAEPGLLTCQVPDVLGDDGTPLAGSVRLELQPLLVARASVPLQSTATRHGGVSYPAADVDQHDAELRSSRGRGRPQTLLPREDWRFARDVDGEPVPDPTSLWVRGGVQPDMVYELIYRTAVSPLVGGGLAAFRDVMSHLRHETSNISHAFAVGWSQSGRFLRELLRDGMNVDEGGRQVFDAVMPFIAGASRGEFNQRQGLPDEALAAGIGHLRPHDLGGLLERQQAVGGVPNVVLVNSASEYWRGDGSLAHTSLDGTADLPEPAGCRQYVLSGTEHVGAADLGFGLPGAPRNHLRVTPINRAVLEMTRQWVVEGLTPPPSAVPRIDDGTAVSRDAVLTQFRALGHPDVPKADQFPLRADYDLGPGAESGVPTYPVRRGEVLPVFVSAVDEDGNEIAGVRHPEVAVALATHTGWPGLLAQGPQWEPLAVLIGNSHPFHRDAIVRRYADRDAYAARVRTAAEELVAARFLLPEDVDGVVASAAEQYDRLTTTSQGD